MNRQLPPKPDAPVTFNIDRGNGGQPQLRSQLTLNRTTGEVVRWEPPKAGRQSELYQMGLEHLGGAAREADAALGEILKAVENTSGQIKKISAAVETVSRDSDELSGAMSSRVFPDTGKPV